MIKIIVADDHKIIREGISNALKLNRNFNIIGEAENGRQALSLVKKLLPDVVIMDISMPELNGMEASSQITSEAPQTKVIALSMHTDRRYVVGMIKAGASGYLSKDCSFAELVDAIDVVYHGDTYLSPKIAETLRLTLLDQIAASSANLAEELTNRERQVLQLIAEGVKTKNIADTMHISIKTVETYRSNIMRKLHIFSVAELTKFAVREGLTPLET